MSDNNLSRKNFLKIAGLSSVAAMSLGGFGVNSIPPKADPGLNLGPDPRPDDFSFYLGSGDTGLFNFIYTVEQLEAAFFTKVIDNLYSNAMAEEERILTDIKQHEIAHRDFYKAFLGENAVSPVNFDFFRTDFTSRESVLENAQIIEDTTVSMYNGVAELFDNADYIPIILEIFSVEGRHATAIRNLRRPDSTFAIGNSIITSNGLDISNPPRNVLNVLFPVIFEKLDISELPIPT